MSAAHPNPKVRFAVQRNPSPKTRPLEGVKVDCFAETYKSNRPRFQVDRALSKAASINEGPAWSGFQHDEVVWEIDLRQLGAPNRWELESESAGYLKVLQLQRSFRTHEKDPHPIVPDLHLSEGLCQMDW